MYYGAQCVPRAGGLSTSSSFTSTIKRPRYLDSMFVGRCARAPAAQRLRMRTWRPCRLCARVFCVWCVCAPGRAAPLSCYHGARRGAPQPVACAAGPPPARTKHPPTTPQARPAPHTHDARRFRRRPAARRPTAPGGDEAPGACCFPPRARPPAHAHTRTTQQKPSSPPPAAARTHPPAGPHSARCFPPPARRPGAKSSRRFSARYLAPYLRHIGSLEGKVVLFLNVQPVNDPGVSSPSRREAASRILHFSNRT